MNLQQPFTDPTAVEAYAQEAPRKVPGFADLQRMTAQLLAEHAPDEAEILVVGAGGGLELKAFAEARPGWRFAGVDPSAPMLEVARRVLGPLEPRVQWHQGYVDSAPVGPFHGATCLLTLHFLPGNERLATLREIHRRMKPGAALVVAHHSCPDHAEARPWLRRSVAFAQAGTIDPAKVAASAEVMAEHLPILSAAEDEELLSEAGFGEIETFYAAFTFRGWVARA